MRILVIGSGAREHALCDALACSPELSRLWCAPGNPGTAQTAENLSIRVEDINNAVKFAADHQVDLVIPGPETPLVLGLTDALAEANIRCFGPTKAAAKLEGSKRFTKEICRAANIPTANWQAFDNADRARHFVETATQPFVIKADGLAAGKGVIVAPDKDESLAIIEDFMERRVLGEAGSAILIEDCLVGEEISFFALCDGETAIPCGVAQDHKRIGERDTGLNTGGMGACSPVPKFTTDLERQVMTTIIRPTLRVMNQRGSPFRGVLFAGLMLTREGPQLMEFNVRFGDPECQALMMRLNGGSLLSAITHLMADEPEKISLDWRAAASLAVVLAAPGYPERTATGSIIHDLDEVVVRCPDVKVYHANTRIDDGRLIVAGGRVLTVCGAGATLQQARDRAYVCIGEINWPEAYYRRDIGWRAL